MRKIQYKHTITNIEMYKLKKYSTYYSFNIIDTCITIINFICVHMCYRKSLKMDKMRGLHFSCNVLQNTKDFFIEKTYP